jgi:ankyrin repeat protein
MVASASFGGGDYRHDIGIDCMDNCFVCLCLVCAHLTMSQSALMTLGAGCLDSTGVIGNSALHWAAAKGHLSLISWLMQQHRQQQGQAGESFVNGLVNQAQQTALHTAAGERLAQELALIISPLCSAGSSSAGTQPLLRAQKPSQPGLCEALLIACCNEERLTCHQYNSAV